MKRKALTVVFVSVLLFSIVIKIQLVNSEPPTLWNKVLMNGSGQSVIQTFDGGYAIAGQSDGKSVLVKTNSEGDVEWSRTYGEVDQPYRALSVIQLSDGGYALGCKSRAGFNFLKTDSAGNMMWCKGFFYGSNDVIEFGSVIQTSDGGFFLAGGCIPGNSGFIVKTDENGNMQWNRTLVERSDSYYLRCAVEAIDDGYLLGGKYLIKVDSLGNTQWNKSITVSTIIKTSDGNYILVGSQPAQLVKIDIQGNTVWSNSYDSYYTTNSGVLTRDGGYIFIGTTSSSAPMSMDYSGYIVKVDANGKIEWNSGYSGSNLINSIIATKDGGYVFTGVNPYYLSGGNNGLWLVKIGGSPSQSPLPSLNPSSSPSTSKSPEPSPSPSTSPSPSLSPSSSQEPQQTESFLTVTVASASVGAVVVVGAGLLVYIKKRNH